MLKLFYVCCLFCGMRWSTCVPWRATASEGSRAVASHVIKSVEMAVLCSVGPNLQTTHKRKFAIPYDWFWLKWRCRFTSGPTESGFLKQASTISPSITVVVIVLNNLSNLSMLIAFSTLLITVAAQDLSCNVGAITQASEPCTTSTKAAAPYTGKCKNTTHSCLTAQYAGNWMAA